MTSRRWLRLFLTTIGVIVGGLVVLGVALYYFGGMWLPSADMRTAYGQMVAAGQAPALESRLTIPIPGCVCHSSDPAQVMTHSTYRIRDCGTCHERVGPPTQ